MKPDTCTERYDVDPPDISRQVTRITLGGPSACLVLLTLRGVGMGRWESAEAILVALTKRRRAESATSGKVAISPLGLDSYLARELATELAGPEALRPVAASIDSWANSFRDASSTRQREAETAGYVIRTSGGVGRRRG